MTALAWALAAVTAAFALTEWWATWTENRSVRLVTKPGTLVALIGVAIALDPVDPTIRTWMVIGLVLSLAGDVFLLFEKYFIPGLVSFLLGHVAYVVALQAADQHLGWAAAGLAVVLVSIAVVARRFVTKLASGEGRELVGPVIAYVIVISSMVVSAFGTASLTAVAGAVLFYVSDATLAWNKFLNQLRFGSIAVMVTYHLGQMGLVAWLVWP